MTLVYIYFQLKGLRFAIERHGHFRVIKCKRNVHAKTECCKTMDYKCLKCYSGWDAYSWGCRIWGVSTAVVLCGAVKIDKNNKWRCVATCMWSFFPVLWGVAIEAIAFHFYLVLCGVVKIDKNNKWRCVATCMWSFFPVLWGVAIEGIAFHFYLGYFLLFSSFIVTFFEAVFVITFWVNLCEKDENSFCVRLWQSIGWVDDWRKGILYTPLAIVCFLDPKEFWIGIIPGVMLLVCAILYSIKTYKARRDKREEELRAKKTYDRFDAEVQEDIEGNALGPEPNERIFTDATSDTENVGDQEEILDV